MFLGGVGRGIFRVSGCRHHIGRPARKGVALLLGRRLDGRTVGICGSRSVESSRGFQYIAVIVPPCDRIGCDVDALEIILMPVVVAVCVRAEINVVRTCCGDDKVAFLAAGGIPFVCAAVYLALLVFAELHAGQLIFQLAIL